MHLELHSFLGRGSNTIAEQALILHKNMVFVCSHLLDGLRFIGSIITRPLLYKKHTNWSFAPLFISFASLQILAVGAEPVLSRLTINGTVLSQIKCAPQSAFSVSMHSSGVCAYLLADPHLILLLGCVLP
jgi:hypothetical protein